MRHGRAIPLLIALALGEGCGILGARGGSWRGGVGAVLRHREREGRLYIQRVPEGGVAERAGLREGDEVLAIDGHAVREMRTTAVVERLRGEVGTRVRLRVRRGEGEREVVVERAPYRGR